MKIIILLLGIFLYSCSPVVSGKITEVKGDTVTCNGYKFIIKNGSIPKLDSFYTFKKIVNRKKINSKYVTK